MVDFVTGLRYPAHHRPSHRTYDIRNNQQSKIVFGQEHWECDKINLLTVSHVFGKQGRDPPRLEQKRFRIESSYLAASRCISPINDHIESQAAQHVVFDPSYFCCLSKTGFDDRKDRAVRDLLTIALPHIHSLVSTIF
jgi:hypothetical protein